jgi:hypothetical protein
VVNLTKNAPQLKKIKYWRGKKLDLKATFLLKEQLKKTPNFRQKQTKKVEFCPK